MEKNQQFVSTLSVKAYRLCQLPRGGSQLRPGLQGLQNQNDALALPSGELSSTARLRGHAIKPQRTPFGTHHTGGGSRYTHFYRCIRCNRCRECGFINDSNDINDNYVLTTVV